MGDMEQNNQFSEVNVHEKVRQQLVNKGLDFEGLKQVIKKIKDNDINDVMIQFFADEILYSSSDPDLDHTEQQARIYFYESKYYPERLIYEYDSSEKEKYQELLKTKQLYPEQVAPDFKKRSESFCKDIEEKLNAKYIDSEHAKLTKKIILLNILDREKKFHPPKHPSVRNDNLNYLTQEAYDILVNKLDFRTQINKEGQVSLELFNFLQEYLGSNTYCSFLCPRAGDTIQNEHIHTCLLSGDQEGNLYLQYMDNETEELLGIRVGDLVGIARAEVKIDSTTRKISFAKVNHKISEHTTPDTIKNLYDPTLFLQEIIFNLEGALIPGIAGIQLHGLSNPPKMRIKGKDGVYKVLNTTTDGFYDYQLQAVKKFLQTIEQEQQ
jgi:hypothetical protein